MVDVKISKQASTHEEIKPLIDLCRAGRLFEVQAWIKSGNAVDPPRHIKGNRKKSPLEYAIDSGFHSLVQVLLDGGADVNGNGSFCPMRLALERRRFDIVKLLVGAGFDPKSVDMLEVFSSWDTEIMEYFIDLDGDVETDHPLVHALCNRVRTALRIVKKYGDKFPCFQEQVDMALRYHCKEGNMKWVSLMLWAGADPLSKGETDPYAMVDVDDEEGGLSALGYAALYDHFDVFKLKQIKLCLEHPAMHQLLGYCNNRPEGVELFERLLKLGVQPNDQENGGCSIVQHLVSRLEWGARHRIHSWDREPDEDGIDSEGTREYMNMIHMLAMYGARWIPDSYEMKSARRSLLKMVPDYTVEFIWILARFEACDRKTAEVLLRTPTIKRHTKRYRTRLDEILNEWPKVEFESPRRT